LLLASTQPGVREAVLEAIETASEVALSELEQQLTMRRGKRGPRSENVAGLLGVKAQHFTTSTGDPHLHVHFVLNASAPSAKDGRWRAIDGNVLFANQRVAEAAFQASLKEEISKRLSVSDWTAEKAGTIVAWEITDLLPAKESLSRATDHMEEIAANLGIGVEGMTRKEHDLVWGLHRQSKREVAEAREHALDAAIAAGGEECEALRQEWRKVLGSQSAALDRIVPKGHPIPDITENPTQKKKKQKQAPKKEIPSIDEWQTRLNNCFDRKQVVARFTVGFLAREIGESVGGMFIASDVTAWFRSQGATLEQSRTMTAQALRFWHEQKLIHFPDDVNPEAVFDTVARGMSENTTLQHQVWSHQARIVPTQLLERDQEAHQIATELGSQTLKTLTIDLSELTDEQARAAQLIGEGHRLVAIQGVAGAGKSHLLKPVVEAAKREGLGVLVMGRNAKLAHELGAELRVDSYTLAAFQTQRREREIEKPTLLIVDEAGVVDQHDWLHVLEVARENKNIQLVAVGDRFQAQPIDQLGTWATVCDAAHKKGVYTNLTQSFRCRAWAEEAAGIRDANQDTAKDVAKIAETDGRIHATGIGWGPELVADLVIQYGKLGEDAMGIAMENKEAAAIASAIQRKLEIQCDPRTRLRWKQQTGVGDIVRTRKNDYRKGIRNGDRWTVTEINDEGLKIRRDDGHETTVSHKWAKEWLELGRAATVDSAQGATVDRAIVLTGSMGRSRLYSATTRGRQAPVFVAETESWSQEEAVQVVTATLCRNDIVKTPRETLRAQDPMRYVLNAMRDAFIMGHEPPENPTQEPVQSKRALRMEHKAQESVQRWAQGTVAMLENIRRQRAEQERRNNPPPPETPNREHEQAEVEQPQIEQIQAKQPHLDQVQSEVPRKEPEVCKVDLHEMGLGSLTDLRKELDTQDREMVKSWSQKALEMLEDMLDIKRQRAEQARHDITTPPERQNSAPRRRL
jgi:hypothetical protein